MNDETREKLAALEHEQWAHWTRYMLSVLDPNENGELAEYFPEVRRWMRQCETPYAELTEAEKDSDRAWADKVIEVVGPTKIETMIVTGPDGFSVEASRNRGTT